jgi:hypothetical protein
MPWSEGAARKPSVRVPPLRAQRPRGSTPELRSPTPSLAPEPQAGADAAKNLALDRRRRSRGESRRRHPTLGRHRRCLLRSVQSEYVQYKPYGRHCIRSRK